MQHPLAEAARIELRLSELDAGGDRDGVIECRIHVLALTQLMVDLYEYPIVAVAEEHIKLSEAYSMGGYIGQALAHVGHGQQIVEQKVFDSGPCLRLGAQLALAEGF